MTNPEYEVLKNEWKDVPVETSRLRIRSYAEKDEDGFFSIFQDARTMQMDGDTPMTAKNDEFYRRMAMVQSGTLLFLCLSDRITDEFIGYVLLNQYPEEQEGAVTLGISLVPNRQNKGYGYEAVSRILSQLKSSTAAHTVLANALLGNAPSLGLIRKLGFTFLGTDGQDEYFIYNM